MARTVRGYTAYNKSVLMRGMTVHAKNVIMPDLLAMLTRVAQDIVAAIDSGSYIPEWTANLHDATGVAIYNDGAVQRFIPTKKAAKKTKSGFGGVHHYDIDGAEFLQRTITDAATTFSKGLWFVVISAVPYAYYIDQSGSPRGRGTGFFKKTHEDALREILAGLRPIASDVSTSTGTSL